MQITLTFLFQILAAMALIAHLMYIGNYRSECLTCQKFAFRYCVCFISQDKFDDKYQQYRAHDKELLEKTEREFQQAMLEVQKRTRRSLEMRMEREDAEYALYSSFPEVLFHYLTTQSK